MGAWSIGAAVCGTVGTGIGASMGVGATAAATGMGISASSSSSSGATGVGAIIGDAGRDGGSGICAGDIGRGGAIIGVGAGAGAGPALKRRLNASRAASKSNAAGKSVDATVGDGGSGIWAGDMGRGAAMVGVSADIGAAGQSRH